MLDAEVTETLAKWMRNGASARLPRPVAAREFNPVDIALPARMAPVKTLYPDSSCRGLHQGGFVVNARHIADGSVSTSPEMLRAHEIDVLVTRNSGGPSTSVKLKAARVLGAPVIMVQRPIQPEGEIVRNVAQVIGWVDRMFRLDIQFMAVDLDPDHREC